MNGSRIPKGSLRSNSRLKSGKVSLIPSKYQDKSIKSISTAQ